MNYELAKELKDAGWPQMANGFYVQINKLGPIPYDAPRSVDYSYYVPTLEELIEACGDEFCCVFNDDTQWSAEDRNNNPAYHAATPSEAVARLWLALQKNNDTITLINPNIIAMDENEKVEETPEVAPEAPEETKEEVQAD